MLSTAYAQHDRAFSFDSLFAKYPDAFDSVLAHKADYRLQVLYTRIDRDAHNAPHLTTYSLDADRYYYYCASMMKLPACALTLEKLNDLSQYRVTMFDSLGIDSIACTQLSPEAMMLGTPYSCLSQYIKEMLLVSNNNAFNPVYDFLGQRAFQDRLHEIGCPDAVVSNRYANCDTISNRKCSPVSLYDRHTHQLRYMQPCIINERPQYYDGPLSPLVGDGYMYGGTLIGSPKSFRYSNYIPLSELHRLLTHIILPETQRLDERLRLTHNDYQYLYKCMGMFPRECAYPTYDSIRYPDSYMKYFMGLDTTACTMPANLRIFNKVGQAYGFMTDCSYIVDTLNKVEFFLSCSMYLNANGILNDGKYEYDQIGFPFFSNLFNAVYEEELTRHRDYKPVLHLPDFTDTLLVKPGPPKWLRIDSAASAEQMEAVLASLADSMWQDRRLPINYDNPTSDEIFYRNLSIALRQKAAVSYPFDALRAKHITMLSSPDQKLRVFNWDRDSERSNYALLQYIDSGQVTLFPLDDLAKEMSPKLTYKQLYSLRARSGTIYLLLGETDPGTGGTQYLQALSLHIGKLVNAPVFQSEAGGKRRYDALLVERHDTKQGIRYDARHKTLSYPQITRTGHKIRVQSRKLKFDGEVFK
ncbi:MAG: serine hydrolase [Bacteroidetes bacterium]|nr:serine hydrolase [Bacteroidota bacterium]